MASKAHPLRENPVAEMLIGAAALVEVAFDTLESGKGKLNGDTQTALLRLDRAMINFEAKEAEL